MSNLFERAQQQQAALLRGVPAAALCRRGVKRGHGRRGAGAGGAGACAGQGGSHPGGVPGRQLHMRRPPHDGAAASRARRPPVHRTVRQRQGLKPLDTFVVLYSVRKGFHKHAPLEDCGL